MTIKIIDLSLPEVYERLIVDLRQTGWLEIMAVVSGIASVVFYRIENILVYPVGMISTATYIYLYINYGLYADASVNFYYTIMSIVGWRMWSHKEEGVATLFITKSNSDEWGSAFLFFTICWLILYLVLQNFTDSTVPIADAFTSAAAYTGMWLMNKKKIESWIWWIITDLASVPLNFHKHLVFTSFQYVVFLILAVMGYISWKKKLPHAAV